MIEIVNLCRSEAMYWQKDSSSVPSENIIKFEREENQMTFGELLMYNGSKNPVLFIITEGFDCAKEQESLGHEDVSGLC